VCVCVFCAYVGLDNRLFSIYYTKKCHVLCEVWHCTLIHSIKLCELHHCTHTQKHTRERTQRNFLIAFWHARGIVFQESVSVTYRLLNLNCSHTHTALPASSVASQNVLQYLTALFPCDIPTSSSPTHAVLDKKCKIFSGGLFLTSTLKQNSEFCKR